MRKAPPCILALALALLCLCPVFSVGVDTYCLEQLSTGEQLAYQAIHYCLTNLIESWNCGSMSQETIQKAYDCILMDHPEIFWSDGYTYVTSYIDNKISGHRVEFTYSMKAPEIVRRNEELENSLMDLVSQVGRLDASYETVKAVYEHMVRTCTYDELNLDQSMYSAMILKSGVCASFAKAFEFTMQCLGIPCTVVFGHLTQSEGLISTSIGHEWNLVQLDGTWYHVDVTSAIALYDKTPYIDYRFLCAPTQDILLTHSIENPVPVPECGSDLEFFELNGLTVKTYSREALAQSMMHAYELGYGPIARFTTYRAMTEAIDDLFTREGIFKAARDYAGVELEQVEYWLDEQTMVLRLNIE